jgi:hypothetical protein
VESVSHAIRKLIQHLPFIQLYFVFHKVAHSIVLAQVLQFCQLLFVSAHCIAVGQLLLEL